MTSMSGPDGSWPQVVLSCAQQRTISTLATLESWLVGWSSRTRENPCIWWGSLNAICSMCVQSRKNGTSEGDGDSAITARPSGVCATHILWRTRCRSSRASRRRATPASTPARCDLFEHLRGEPTPAVAPLLCPPWLGHAGDMCDVRKRLFVPAANNRVEGPRWPKPPLPHNTLPGRSSGAWWDSRGRNAHM